MTRFVVVARDPALRDEITAGLASHPHLVPAGAVASERGLWRLLRRARPEVVVLDHDACPARALAACSRVKHRTRAPRIVFAAASPTSAVAVAAWLAGADDVAPAGDARALAETVRAVGRGDRRLPPVPGARRMGGVRFAPAEPAERAARPIGLAA